jgi:hypothetical protein
MLYNDLFEMFDAILAYVSEHPGCEILSADDPFARRVGFSTRMPERPWYFRVRDFLGRWRPLNFLCVKYQCEVWEIGLSRVKDSMNKKSVTEETRVILRKVFTTRLGRDTMAEALTRGRNPCSLE